MLKYEIIQVGKCSLEFSGSLQELEFDAAYMITLIYNDLFKSDQAKAAIFRHATLYEINGAMDAIERGDFDNDNHIT